MVRGLQVGCPNLSVLHLLSYCYQGRVESTRALASALGARCWARLKDVAVGRSWLLSSPLLKLAMVNRIRAAPFDAGVDLLPKWHLTRRMYCSATELQDVGLPPELAGTTGDVTWQNVVSYLRQQAASVGDHPIRATVIVCGFEGAGKTTLVHRLTCNEFIADTVSTDGVETRALRQCAGTV